MASKELKIEENDILNINLDIKNEEDDMKLYEQLQTHKSNLLAKPWGKVKLKTLNAIIKCYPKIEYFPTHSVEFLLLDDTRNMRKMIHIILKNIKRLKNDEYLTMVDWIRTFALASGISIEEIDDSFDVQFYDVLMNGMEEGTEDTDCSDVLIHGEEEEEEQFELELSQQSFENLRRNLQDGIITTAKYVDYLLDYNTNEDMWDVVKHHPPLTKEEWSACFDSCVSIMHVYGIRILLEVNEEKKFVAQYKLFSTCMLAIHNMDSDQFRHNMTEESVMQTAMLVNTFATKPPKKATMFEEQLMECENNENVPRSSNRPLPVINYDDSDYVDTTPGIGKYAPKRKR